MVKSTFYSFSMTGLQQNINRFCVIIKNISTVVLLQAKLIHTNVNLNSIKLFLTIALIAFLRTGKLSL